MIGKFEMQSQHHEAKTRHAESKELTHPLVPQSKQEMPCILINGHAFLRLFPLKILHQKVKVLWSQELVLPKVFSIKE